MLRCECGRQRTTLQSRFSPTFVGSGNLTEFRLADSEASTSLYQPSHLTGSVFILFLKKKQRFCVAEIGFNTVCEFLPPHPKFYDTRHMPPCSVRFSNFSNDEDLICTSNLSFPGGWDKGVT